MLTRLLSPLVILSLFAAAPASARASPLDGTWKIVFPCKSVGEGEYPKRCAAGDRDHFILDLWSQGDLLCGTHELALNLGDQLDESVPADKAIAGRITGRSATVTFHIWSASGHATLRVRGGKLHWDVVDQDKGFSQGIPTHVVLLRQRVSGADGARACGS